MHKFFNQPVNELIKTRHSVRNYKEEPLPETLITKINDYISSVENPFHKKVNIRLIEKSTQAADVKLGTYGVIKGANYFLVTSCENDEKSLMALGYSFEKVILYCTSLGLGTVWLGGTFHKSSFAKAISLKPNEILPIVAPVGYESGKQSLIGRMLGNNKNKRKDFSDIFFEHSFAVALQPEKADVFTEPLDMLRRAPSAVNKQPWRAVKVGDIVHFYLINTKGLTRIDIGIGLCHFDLSAREMGIEGKFKLVENTPVDKDYTYVISWVKMK